MLAGLRVLGRGLNSVRWNGYAYIWANLAFLALSLPIITLPAAFSALFRIGHDTFTEPSEADLTLFWETFRANLRRATLWGLANLAFAVVNFSNLMAYQDRHDLSIQVLRIVWVATTYLWCGVLLYTWPIFYEMETPSIWLATRNAVVMTLLNPIFTLVVLLGILLLSVISTVLVALWMVLTFGIISAVGNAAVLDRLATYRKTKESQL